MHSFSTALTVGLVLLGSGGCQKRAAQGPLDSDAAHRGFTCSGSQCSFQCAGSVCTCEVAPAARGDAYEKLQACIDATPEGGKLKLPPGDYLVRKTLRIERALTLQSDTVQADCKAGTGCAVLKASADFTAMIDPRNPDFRDGGLIWALGRTPALSHVVLDRLVLDGNRGGRYDAGNTGGCTGAEPRTRFSGKLVRLGHHQEGGGVCHDCQITNSLLQHGLCTGAVALSGDRILFRNNVLRNVGWSLKNGSSQFRGDGVAVVRGEQIQIIENLIQDASDVGIMMQGGKSAVVRRNTIRQESSTLAHGIHLHNGGSDTTGNDDPVYGNYTGARIQGNTIDCTDANGHSACDVGIMVGPQSYRDRCGSAPFCRVHGGVVEDNAIVGARVGVLVDGAQDAASEALVIRDNEVASLPLGSLSWYCNERSNADRIADDFVVGDFLGSIALSQVFRSSSAYRGLCNQAPPPAPTPTPDGPPPPPPPPPPADPTADVRVEGRMKWTTDTAGTQFIRGDYAFSEQSFPIARTRTINLCGRCVRTQDGEVRGAVTIDMRTEFAGAATVFHGGVTAQGTAEVCYSIGPSDRTSVRVITCDAGAGITAVGRVINSRP